MHTANVVGSMENIAVIPILYASVKLNLSTFL